MFFAKLEGLGPYSKGYDKEGRKTIRVIRGATTKHRIAIENKDRGQESIG